MSESKLTAKQEAFCTEYMIDLNATQAAIRAGYSEDSAKQIASQNLSKHDVAERIVELKAERATRTLVTADYVLEGLLEVHRRCMTDDPDKMEHSGANKSLELLGKHLGMFIERKEITGFDGAPLTTTVNFVPVSADG